MLLRVILLAAASHGAQPQRNNKSVLRPHERLDDRAFAYALQLAAKKPGVVLDVGANGGKQSMMAVLAGRKVYAVECLARAYTELLDIFQGHSAQTISVLHACGGHRPQLGQLHLASDSSSLFEHNVLMGREAQKHKAERRATEPVVVLPLDLLFRSQAVALVKVDTQGAEFSVLTGLSEVLRQRPVVMYESVHRFVRAAGKNFKDPQAVLRPLGYNCTAFCDDLCNRGWRLLAKSQSDYVCESRGPPEVGSVPEMTQDRGLMRAKKPQKGVAPLSRGSDSITTGVRTSGVLHRRD